MNPSSGTAAHLESLWASSPASPPGYRLVPKIYHYVYSLEEMWFHPNLHTSQKQAHLSAAESEQAEAKQQRDLGLLRKITNFKGLAQLNRF